MHLGSAVILLVMYHEAAASPRVGCLSLALHQICHLRMGRVVITYSVVKKLSRWPEILSPLAFTYIMVLLSTSRGGFRHVVSE